MQGCYWNISETNRYLDWIIWEMDQLKVGYAFSGNLYVSAREKKNVVWFTELHVEFSFSIWFIWRFLCRTGAQFSRLNVLVTSLRASLREDEARAGWKVFLAALCVSCVTRGSAAAISQSVQQLCPGIIEDSDFLVTQANGVLRTRLAWPAKCA